jgi:hypothetical protein
MSTILLNSKIKILGKVVIAGIEEAPVYLTNTILTTFNEPVTSFGNFLRINVDGQNQLLKIWNPQSNVLSATSIDTQKVYLTNPSIVTFNTPVTASESFLSININDETELFQLWDSDLENAISLSADQVYLTNTILSTFNSPVTASDSFLSITVNGQNNLLQLWNDY